MNSPKKVVTTWLDRPHDTNRDALVVGIGGGYSPLWCSGWRGKYSRQRTRSTLVTRSLWLAALISGTMLALGLLMGARRGRHTDVLKSQISGLEARTEELGGYTLYAEHLRDALADLRRFHEGELPGFSLRDFIENGLFETAQRLLSRDSSRGEIRFSVLHPDGDDFIVGSAEGLFPALGHSPEGRGKFRMPIDDSFSGLAYRQRKVFASGKLSDDERFTPHPKSKRPYESIVSVPLWLDGKVGGVLNVVGTKPDAFNAVDRSYIALVGSVIDVGVAASADEEEEPGAPSHG